MVGDLKYSRTIHSLIRLLSNYQITFNLVSVNELQLDENTKQFLDEKGITYQQFNSINDVINTTDVIYMTRIQKERFELDDPDVLDSSPKLTLRLTPEILTNAKHNVVIMHPLPRNDEIDVNIDNDPRAAYFRQMENGMYVRMALMLALI